VSNPKCPASAVAEHVEVPGRIRHLPLVVDDETVPHMGNRQAPGLAGSEIHETVSQSVEVVVHDYSRQASLPLAGQAVTVEGTLKTELDEVHATPAGAVSYPLLIFVAVVV